MPVTGSAELITPGPDDVAPDDAGAEVAGGDAAVLEDVRARLLATGEFGAVELVHSGPHDAAAGADAGAVAWVWAESWEEPDEGSDAEWIEHRVHLAATLAARDADPARLARTLTRLAAVACNAVNGQALAGTCMPGWTRLRKGKPDVKVGSPEGRVNLTGEARYLIPGDAAHDTTWTD